MKARKIKIELNDIETRNRFASQLTKYLGGADKVKEFAKECKAVGLEIGDPNIIRNIAEKPEWLTTLINYSELGLLRRLGKAIDELKTQ